MERRQIVEENQRAARAQIHSMEAASELVKRLKMEISTNPVKALSAYGNVELSGRHIVWGTTRH
jgi:hypothetical protein